jgi:hypothetical protein
MIHVSDCSLISKKRDIQTSKNTDDFSDQTHSLKIRNDFEENLARSAFDILRADVHKDCLQAINVKCYNEKNAKKEADKQFEHDSRLAYKLLENDSRLAREEKIRHIEEAKARHFADSQKQYENDAQLAQKQYEEDAHLALDKRRLALLEETKRDEELTESHFNELELASLNITKTVDREREAIVRIAYAATVRPKKKAVINDARAFAEDYDNKTLLQVCAICGIEDSPGAFKEITSIPRNKFADVTKLFSELTSFLRSNNDRDTSYDINYASQ